MIVIQPQNTDLMISCEMKITKSFSYIDDRNETDTT